MTSLIILAVFCGLTSCAEKQAAESYKVHAEKLKQTFEPVLFTLAPVKQKHYAVRLYRVTGDRRYIYPIIFHLLTTLTKLQFDQRGLDDSDYIKQRMAVDTRDASVPHPPGHEMRYALSAEYDELAFYRELCKNLHTLREYNLLESGVLPGADRLMAALHGQKDRLAAYLLDGDRMKTSGAQMVNHVYYLYRLNVIDIRHAYLDALKKTLMQETPDDKLTDLEYRDKIYALTHVILAAGDYYQEYVDRNAFGWIFDYFEHNIGPILARTKPDIYAEVGLCFLLAKDGNNPALKKIKDAIVSNICPEKGMILSETGSDDMSKGEHRNVLAIMLLDWPTALFPGPDLKNAPEFQGLLPIPARAGPLSQDRMY